MIQKTKILILFLTLSLFSVKHVAADATADDFQVWGNVTALGNFGAINPNNPDLKRFRWWMEGQGRFGNEASQFTQALIRPGLGYAITDKIVVWAGYAWAPTAEPLAFRPFNERRTWEQVTWLTISHLGVYRCVVDLSNDSLIIMHHSVAVVVVFNLHTTIVSFGYFFDIVFLKRFNVANSPV